MLSSPSPHRRRQSFPVVHRDHRCARCARSADSVPSPRRPDRQSPWRHQLSRSRDRPSRADGEGISWRPNGPASESKLSLETLAACHASAGWCIRASLQDLCPRRFDDARNRLMATQVPWRGAAEGGTDGSCRHGLNQAGGGLPTSGVQMGGDVRLRQW